MLRAPVAQARLPRSRRRAVSPAAATRDFGGPELSSPLREQPAQRSRGLRARSSAWATASLSVAARPAGNSTAPAETGCARTGIEDSKRDRAALLADEVTRANTLGAEPLLDIAGVHACRPSCHGESTMALDTCRGRRRRRRPAHDLALIMPADRFRQIAGSREWTVSVQTFCPS